MSRKNPNADPNKNPLGNDPLEQEEYEAVKSRYPNLDWDDTDQSFTSKKGHKSYARRLRTFRPPTPEMWEKAREVTVSTAQRRYDNYIKCIENGMRVSEACKKAGISYVALKSYRANHPDFVEREREAEQIAAEPVENSLYEAAVSGNVPAAIKWLEKRAPERWPGDKIQIDSKQTLELDASDRIGNIMALMGRLQQRAALEEGYIDVEAEEPRTDHSASDEKAAP